MNQQGQPVLRYLGLDLGDRRTGIAAGDSETRMASPLDVIEASLDSGALLGQLLTLIQREQPDVLVVGLPVNMDGTHGPRARKTVLFANELAEQSNLPVVFHDERLSSYAADQAMARSGLTHKQKKKRRDALAAAATLQDFLTHEDGQ